MRRRSRAVIPNALPSPPPPVPGLIWGDRATHRAIDCWWPGALPAGSLVKIEGRKSTGKSTIAAAIAASVSGGPVIPGWTGPRDRRVMWQGAEEDWHSVIGPRLTLAGVPDGMYGFLEVPDSHRAMRRPILPDDLQILQDTLREADIGLLVLDPFSSIAHPAINMKDPQEARRYLESIAQVVALTNTVCLCVGHVRKGRGGDAREAGYFSAEVTNVMRSVMRCDEHPHERGKRVLSVVAYNYGPPRPTQVYTLFGGEDELPRVSWHGACDLDAETICEGRGPEGERDEWNDADRLLASAIGSGWCSVTEIEREAEAAGVSPRTIRRAKARLHIPSRRISLRDGGHWEWGAPPTGWPPGLTLPEPVEGSTRNGAASLAPLPEKPTKKRRKMSKAAKDAMIAAGDTPPLNEAEGGHNGTA